LVVRGSADGLLSVFGNLLSNAVHYTRPGGLVSVSSSLLGDRVCVTFRDSGIGIQPEQIDKIFEKFYRAPEARQLESRGLGLVLSLVQQMVRAHGGEVQVESAQGKGSTFRTWFPRKAYEDGK